MFPPANGAAWKAGARRMWQWVGKLPSRASRAAKPGIAKNNRQYAQEKLDLRDFDDGRASAALQVCQGVRDHSLPRKRRQALLARGPAARFCAIHQTQPGCAGTSPCHLFPWMFPDA